MLELTLVCLLCAEVPDLSLVQQPARLGALQPTAAGGVESKPAPSRSSQMMLELGTAAGVSLLGYGIGLSGEFNAGRLAADWAGGFVATLPLAALAATLVPKTRAEWEDRPGRGILASLTAVVGTPLAAAGGVVAAEALAGHPVQWRAFWEGGVLGALVGYAAALAVYICIDWLVPGAMLTTKNDYSWGQEFLLFGGTFSLIASAWAASGYSTHVSPR